MLLFPDAAFLKKTLEFFAPLFFSDADARTKELIKQKNFSDCVFLPEENKKFSVEDAENLLEESLLKPLEGDIKLFVIGDFSDATVQAQNKLLKLLEEPPEGVYFLLGASAEFSVLPTVLSRTQKLEIQPFSNDEIAAYLQRNYPSAKFDNTVLDVAAGLPGKAEELVLSGYFQELKRLVFTLFSGEQAVPMAAKKLGDTKHKKETLFLLRMLLKNALLIRSGIPVPPSVKAEISPIASSFSSRALLVGQDAVAEAEKDLRFNAVFNLLIEKIFIKIYQNNDF